ncbi:hypothetical protein NEUTE2DRAFT_65575 [Neurospora tetrasperma FGSC 2509]|nr:hypothetical protein NEUTE2DRAFT_65575 [Neurospora tetrasperma FGSC 2509]
MNLWAWVNAAASASSCSQVAALPTSTFFSDFSKISLKNDRSSLFKARRDKQKSEGNERTTLGTRASDTG